MPNEGRATAGWLFSRGYNHGLDADGEHMGVGGTATDPGKLVYLRGDEREGAKPAIGRTKIERWTWNHVALVRDGKRVQLFLNGQSEPELSVESAVPPAALEEFYFGGRCDNESNWEGRLDEIALFDRALTGKELEAIGK